MTIRSSRHGRHLFPALLAAAVVATLAAGGSPAEAQESAQPGVTTTTLPTDNRQLGDIIPQPNTGREPQTAGEPGGWLQVSLFFLLIAAVVVIASAVWWTSRRARQRREAAGLDPISVARRRGEGVRQPRTGVPPTSSGDAPEHP